MDLHGRVVRLQTRLHNEIAVLVNHVENVAGNRQAGGIAAARGKRRAGNGLKRSIVFDIENGDRIRSRIHREEQLPPLVDDQVVVRVIRAKYKGPVLHPCSSGKKRGAWDLSETAVGTALEGENGISVR